MIVEFTVSVKVPDPKDNDLQNDPDLIEQMDAMLAVFEDEANKAGMEINETNWEAYD
jgi:hypothetical protein